MIDYIRFLVAFICDSNQTMKNSTNLYQIVGLLTVNPLEKYPTLISMNDIDSGYVIFGLDNVFNREKGKKIYVSMNDTDSTKIYFDDQEWDIHSDVPKLFEPDKLTNLNCHVVKFCFTNLILGKFDFIIHYDLNENSYTPIFEHYELYSGNDVGILNNTKYKIKCINYGHEDYISFLSEILYCLDVSFYESNGLTRFGDFIALISERDASKCDVNIIVPKTCKVVYIYRPSKKKLALKTLILTPSVEHISQEGNFSFASDEVKIYLSKNAKINSLFGNISSISDINHLRQYTGLDIEEY